MHQRAGTVAPEQRSCIPPQVGGALCPAFVRNDEAVGVDDELTPSVGGNIPWVMLIVEARDTLEPRARHADDVAKFGWHLYIVDDGARWCGANNPIAIDDLPLGFG